MTDFNKLRSSITRNPVAANGKASSDDMNDFMERTVHDFAQIYRFLNDSVIGAMNGLGQSGTWSDIDPITNGIDGSTVLTDRDYGGTSPYFYNTEQGRPRSIAESVARVETDLDALYRAINEVRSRLGTPLGDEDAGSRATLAELETRVIALNGLVNTVRSESGSYLTAAEIATALEDNTIEPTSWILGADVAVNAAIAPTSVSGIDLTSSPGYSSVPANYDVQDAILRVKEWVEDSIGVSFASYTASNAPTTDLETHVTTSGTGTVGAANPHGLDVGDLTDASNFLGRPVLMGEFNIASSAVTISPYSYVPETATVTRVSATVVGGGAVTSTVYRRRGAVEAVIYGPLITPGTSPGLVTATAGFTNTSLQVGDLIFVSGLSGAGNNWRIQLWAERA